MDLEEPLTISLKLQFPGGRHFYAERRIPMRLAESSVYDWYNVEIGSAAAQLEGAVKQEFDRLERNKARREKRKSRNE